MYSGNALVTVLMTAYNAEAFIKQSVESVLNQTYKNIFFVIVNDGSNDKTMEVLKSFNDQRIKIIDNSENRHIAYGLNCGLKYLKGEYLAIMDADDVWHPDKLEIQLEYLENHPEYEGCFSWAEIIDEKGNVRGKEYDDIRQLFACNTDTREEWLRFFFFKGNRLSNPSSMISTKAALEIGSFNPFYIQALDMDWWVRFIKKYSFGIIQKKLLSMRVRTDNTSNYSIDADDRSYRFINEWLQIRLHFFDDMDRNLFIRTFKDYFVCPDSSTDLELKCEQAFLHLRPIKDGNFPTPAAFIAFEDLMKNKETLELLNSKYKFRTRTLGKYTGKHVYYDRYAESVQLERDALFEHNRVKNNQIQSLITVNNILSDENRHLNFTINDLKCEISKKESIINEKDIYIDKQQKEINKVTDALNTITNSSAWKITEPLRKIKDKIKK